MKIICVLINKKNEIVFTHIYISKKIETCRVSMKEHLDADRGNRYIPISPLSSTFISFVHGRSLVAVVNRIVWWYLIVALLWHRTLYPMSRLLHSYPRISSDEYGHLVQPVSFHSIIGIKLSELSSCFSISLIDRNIFSHLRFHALHLNKVCHGLSLRL